MNGLWYGGIFYLQELRTVAETACWDLAYTVFIANTTNIEFENKELQQN